MVQGTKVISKVELSMGMGDLYTLMEMFMKGNGCLTKHMVKGRINTLRMEEVSMLAAGYKTSSMEKAKKNGLMVRFTLDVSFRGKNRVLANSNGLTETATKESFGIIKYMDKGPTFGMTDVSTLGSGLTTKWKVLVSSSGQMDGVIVVVTKLTSSLDKGSLSGPVVSSTMVGG